MSFKINKNGEIIRDGGGQSTGGNNGDRRPNPPQGSDAAQIFGRVILGAIILAGITLLLCSL